MAKTQIIKLHRYLHGTNCEILYYDDNLDMERWTMDFCWRQFKQLNPAICKDLREGQTRKLKRTQLKNGFKLERIK